MVVCKYFLKGQCAFGNKCRYEHTVPASDYGNSWGGDNYHSRGRNTHGTQSHNDGSGYGRSGRGRDNYYAEDDYSNYRDQSYGESQHGRHSGYSTYASPDPPRVHSAVHVPNPKDRASSPQTDDVLAQVLDDMKQLETSGMWPFSCYAFMRDVSSLPGLDDLSMDEVRFQAYEASATGHTTEYAQLVNKWLQNNSIDFRTVGGIELFQQTGFSASSISYTGSSSSATSPFTGSGGPTAPSFGFTSGQVTFPPTASVSTPFGGGFSSVSSELVQPHVAANSSSTTSFSGFGPAAQGQGFGFAPAVPVASAVQPTPAAGFGFGAASATTSVTAATTAVGHAGQAVTATHINSTSNNLFTPVDQLTPEDKAQFEAVKFTLGAVPVKPPPQVYV